MGEGEGVRDRKYYPCPNTLDWSVEDRLRKCPMCGVFLLYCCNCNTKYPQRTGSDGIPIPCHHFRVVFTDGACSNNGKLTARAGMGMVCGDDEDSEASIPITDMVDSFPLRSSQRAELCAAQYGIVLLAKSDTTDCGGETREWVVATDSEYVVKGLSEWLPSWKVCYL
jgi:ribonuclease HI